MKPKENKSETQQRIMNSIRALNEMVATVRWIDMSKSAREEFFNDLELFKRYECGEVETDLEGADE